MNKNLYPFSVLLVCLLLSPGTAVAQDAGNSQNSHTQLFPVDPATHMFKLPPAIQAKIDRLNQGGVISMNGDNKAKQGDWLGAVKDYHQALALDPDDAPALYGLAAESLRQNDLMAAVNDYRHAIYDHPTPPPPALPGYHEINAYRLMEYVLLLSKTGQQDEALTVYQHAATLVNYIDGHPHVVVPLPDFGDGPGQVPFTPQRLQAMADVGWAADHGDWDRAATTAKLDEAVALFPDSPVPYFYRAAHRGKTIYAADHAAARADFDKAVQIGGPEMGGAVQRMKHLLALTDTN